MPHQASLAKRQGIRFSGERLAVQICYEVPAPLAKRPKAFVFQTNDRRFESDMVYQPQYYSKDGRLTVNQLSLTGLARYQDGAPK